MIQFLILVCDITFGNFLAEKTCPYIYIYIISLIWQKKAPKSRPENKKLVNYSIISLITPIEGLFFTNVMLNTGVDHYGSLYHLCDDVIQMMQWHHSCRWYHYIIRLI